MECKKLNPGSKRYLASKKLNCLRFVGWKVLNFSEFKGTNADFPIRIIENPSYSLESSLNNIKNQAFFHWAKIYSGIDFS